MNTSTYNHSTNSYVDSRSLLTVDFNLLVPTLILLEALVPSYKQQKVVMSLLDFVIKNKAKVGKAGLLDWLRSTEFPFTDKLETVLTQTPLGNPAWGLFGSAPERTLELIKDLDRFILQQSSSKPASLKSLVKEFINLCPQYGGSISKNFTTFRNGKIPTLLEDGNWRSVGLGDVVTRLVVLQASATPESTRQVIMKKLALNPDANIKATVKKDGFPIHRPDFAYYQIALRDLLIGTAVVEDEVWGEMVSMYMGKHLTNFLAFAPLLLQPFATSDINIPVPAINTLATLMGNFTGATGTFMGEITRSKKTIRWETLGLTIGKLCEKTDVLADVSLHGREEQEELDKLSYSLSSTVKICGDLPHMTATPKVGEDRGHVLIKEDYLHDRWNINLRDINDSIISDKIHFNKFPMVSRSLVFTNSRMLTRLDLWSRKQMRREIVCQLFGGSGGMKLPSTQSVATNNFSVLPLLTYTFRLEKKRQSSFRRTEILVSKVEAKTKTYLDSKELNDFSNDTEQPIGVASVCKKVGLSEQANSEEAGGFVSSATPTNKPPSVLDDGMQQFFIAETYKEEQQKKAKVLSLRNQRLIQLKQEKADLEAASDLGRMDLNTLIDHISLKLTELKADSKCSKLSEQLGLAFSVLVERQLHLTFPSSEDLCFRYQLGDEEVLAIEAWFNREDDEIPTSIPVTKAVRRIWVGLTYVWLCHYTVQNGIPRQSDDDFWHYDIYKKYPLVPEDRHSVWSLVPYLYWLTVLNRPDVFRSHGPDMSTILFVPTSRLWSDRPLDERLLEGGGEATWNDPARLDDASVSSLSLCSIVEWSPDEILQTAKKRFGIDYSPDFHPEVTKYVRLYVRLGVESLIRRLSNRNLARFVHHVSSTNDQLTLDDVWERFLELKGRVRQWYANFTSEFYNRWDILGGEWVEFRDLTHQLPTEDAEHKLIQYLT